jgi:hypothetical protein
MDPNVTDIQVVRSVYIKIVLSGNFLGILCVIIFHDFFSFINWYLCLNGQL